MRTPSGHVRLYDSLCRVLDALREESPSSSTIYNPPPSNADAVIQARSRALLHLFLKARFGLIDFDGRESLVTDGPHDGGIDAYYIDQRNKLIYIMQSKFRATAANFVSTNIAPLDLLKMDVSRILKGEKRAADGSPYNEQITKGLQRAIRKVPDIGSYNIHVVLLGNTKSLSEHQLKRLIEGYRVDQFPHDRVYLITPVPGH